MNWKTNGYYTHKYAYTYTIYLYIRIPVYLYTYTIYLIPYMHGPGPGPGPGPRPLRTKIRRNLDAKSTNSTKIEWKLERGHWMSISHIHICIYQYINISIDFLLIHISNCELNDGRGPHENSPSAWLLWIHVAFGQQYSGSWTCPSCRHGICSPTFAVCQPPSQPF